VKRIFAPLLAALALLGAATACVIADPSPYAHGLLQPNYNRAWNTAIDAMKDEGVQVTMADLAAGRLEGRRGGITLEVAVARDKGGIDTDFTARGAVAEDPTLVERVRARYTARLEAATG